MKRFLSLVLALMLTLGAAATAVAEEVDIYYLNEKIASWCDFFNGLMEEYAAILMEDGISIDVVYATGVFFLPGNTIVNGPTGVPRISGAAISPNETVQMWLGSGLEGYEDHWAASLQFTPETADETIFYSGISFVWACEAAGLELPEDGEEKMRWIKWLLNELFISDDIAIEVDGLVFVGKELPGGVRILAVDSLPYYNEFYYNDTQNYYIIE